ncbi:hypothetical protein K435DRAFT_881519 [Dendrothele bispora CBS 962.96]|uniref:Uncharacterized protein n=1 Tax=Dendrothele bispora (strain CBS 962.96) TaxID=1314807 RepID=A0A4S8KIG2_DENBC|nr:hypothetical protein K435DRAFT_881519 [Dendrothele bispora CBS 962.96]
MSQVFPRAQIRGILVHSAQSSARRLNSAGKVRRAWQLTRPVVWTAKRLSAVTAARDGKD